MHPNLGLAPYASFAEGSRGRDVAEPGSAHRNCWQRDRDRVLHASAFRRLKAKTQVFIADEGDLYRTRLTHSLEVAQVARTIARALSLHEDLTECIALAHDLGHPPFGHTGEDALDAAMQPYGGFNHNAQALRIVTELEQHYADFDGLNLTWESLEGIAKHNGPVHAPYPAALRGYPRHEGLELSTHASAEAQVAALSDDIAYTHHDLQDGLRSGLLHEADLHDLPVIGEAYRIVDGTWPDLDAKRRRHEALRHVFGILVTDVISASRTQLEALNAHSVQDIRNAGRQIVRFSDVLWSELKIVRKFLFDELYRAPPVVERRKAAAEIIQVLFAALQERPSEMPSRWQTRLAQADETARARIVSDYVSGMTDPYAMREYERLTGKTSPLAGRALSG